MPGWPEIMVILLIVLVLFGSKKLPELARGLAQSVNEFRKARDEFDKEIHSVKKDVVPVEPAGKQAQTAPTVPPSQPQQPA